MARDTAIVVGITDPHLRTQAAHLISQGIEWDPDAVERGINYHLTEMDQTRDASRRRGRAPSTTRTRQR